MKGRLALVLGGVALAALLVARNVTEPAATEATTTPAASGAAQHAATPLPFDWPPRLGERYPDVEAVDQTGRTVRLSSFEGRVILLEPVGMSCPMCQQFAGAGKHGGYGGVRATPGMASLEEWIPEHAGGLSRDDPRFVFVQLLLFDMKLKPTEAAHAKAWAEHFGMDRSRDRVVLAAGPAFLQPAHYKASYDLVPGLQLIDKSFVLRWDGTGHRPTHSWWRDVLPNLPRLIEEPVGGD